MASNTPTQDGSQGKKKQAYTVRTRRGRYDSDKISETDEMKDGELKYAVCTPIPSRSRPSLSGAFESSSPKTNSSGNQQVQPNTPGKLVQPNPLGNQRVQPNPHGNQLVQPNPHGNQRVQPNPSGNQLVQPPSRDLKKTDPQNLTLDRRF